MVWTMQLTSFVFGNVAKETALQTGPLSISPEFTTVKGDAEDDIGRSWSGPTFLALKFTLGAVASEGFT